MAVLNSENGGELINVRLIEWAEQHRIDLTSATA